MGTWPSKDEGMAGMGMCWSWCSLIFRIKMARIATLLGVLFLDWEWVKMMNQFPKIDGSAPLKIAIFVGPKDTPLMWLAENAAFPLAVPSISIRTPLSTRHLQIQMLAIEKIRFRQLDFTKECLKNSGKFPDEDSCCFLPKSPIERAWFVVRFWCPLRTFWRCPVTSHIQRCLHDAHVPQIHILVSPFGCSNGKEFQHGFSHKTTYPLVN